MDSGPKQGEKYNCEVCGQPLTFIAAYNAWYCYVCRKYGTPKPAQQAQPASQYDFNAYQPPTTYVATQPEAQKPQVQPQPQPQPQTYQRPTVYTAPQTQPQTQPPPQTQPQLPATPPYAPPQPQPQRPQPYGQQAYSGSYNSYGSEPARPPVQQPPVAHRPSDGRPQQLKCRECGMPLPSSGECPQCKAKELIALAEQMLGVASTSGIDVTKADRLLREAKTSLDEGNFGEARTAAEKAQTMIEEQEDQHAKAKDQLADAQSVVGGVKRRGVDTGQADSLIQLAQSFMKTGNYEKSMAYAKKAIKTANEAETRQATEKALESRPQMPPAVARPVDTGDEEAPAPKLPTRVEPTPQVTEQAQPDAPVECPACGESVEAGWKRCPNCTAPLVSAAPVPPTERPKEPQPPPDMTGEIKVPPRPEPKEPTPPKDESPEVKVPKPEPKTPLKVPPKEPEVEEKKDPEYAAVEKEIKTVEAELEAMEKKGENVAHARNLLKLAFSFLRGGSYEKATRYARKVKNVLDEKKDE